MLKKRGADWGDNVRLVGLSIDQDLQKLKDHIKDKEWTDVEHYHVRTAGCSADNEYGVQGVPHVLLVDTHGKIVFMGHPAERDIEKDIDQLLKGETLTGKGCQAAESKEEVSSEDKEASADLDEAIKKFTDDTKVLVETIKPKVEGLKNAFLVLVDEAKFNCKTQKWSHDVQVITRLIGQQEAIDIVSQEAAKVSKGPWKNVDQFRAM